MKRFMTEIVGNDALCSRLGQDALFDTLPHALIIEGRKGTGKHTIAKMIAASLACSKKDNDSLPLPCLECIDCRKVLENKSPDVITLGRDGKATLGVDTIRFIKEDIPINNIAYTSSVNYIVLAHHPNDIVNFLDTFFVCRTSF